MNTKKHKETTVEKIKRLRIKRAAIQQDLKEFGVLPDLNEDDRRELAWLEDIEERYDEVATEIWEEKRRGLLN